MVVSYIYKIFWLIGLVLLQVLMLNNMQLFGVATPFLYIYLLLKFSSDTSRNALMLWAFLQGLLVDIFSDTLGMNASAAVLLAFVRPMLLRLFTPRDMLDSIVPGIRTMGFTPFLKFAAASVAVHHLLLISLEYFSFVYIGELLLRVTASTLLTVVCIMALEGAGKE